MYKTLAWDHYKSLYAFYLPQIISTVLGLIDHDGQMANVPKPESGTKGLPNRVILTNFNNISVSFHAKPAVNKKSILQALYLK